MRIARVFGYGAAALLATPLLGQASPPSLLDQPAAPPEISLSGDLLTIHAANSSLRAILDDLETRTGAKVEGLDKDERIFGVYGPGKPQDVLSSLLDDSGYNVLIAGRRPDGAPREIVLSTKQAAPAAAAQNAPTQAAQDEEGDSSDQGQQPQPALFGPISPGSPGVGTPPPQGGGAQPQVKTPQQMLEELQRLRQTQTAPQPH